MTKKTPTPKEIETVLEYFEGLKDKTAVVRNKVDKHVIPFVISGFAFIVALVWRDFIRDIVDAIIASTGFNESGYLYSLLSAILVSLIAILVVLFLARNDKDD